MSDLESGTTQTTTFIGGTKAQAELQAAPMTQLIASNAVGPDTVYKIAVVDASEEISDPSALGLFAFSISTLMFGLLSVEASPPNFGEIVMPLVIFHGGLAQLIAGLFEFVKKNQFGATCFTTWGSFFMGVGVFYILVLTRSFPDGAAVLANWSATAIVYSLYGIFAFALAIMASRVALAISGIFFSASLLFFVGAASGYSHNAKLASGAFGILTGVIGMYCAVATMVNAAAGKYLIPLGKFEKK